MKPTSNANAPKIPQRHSVAAIFSSSRSKPIQKAGILTDKVSWKDDHGMRVKIDASIKSRIKSLAIRLSASIFGFTLITHFAGASPQDTEPHQTSVKEHCQSLLAHRFLDQWEILQSYAGYNKISEILPDGEKRSFVEVDATHDWNLTLNSRKKSNWQAPSASATDWHHAGIKQYYELLSEQREFSKARLELFRKIEKSVPIYRQKFFKQISGDTGELIGMVRIVDGTRETNQLERRIVSGKRSHTLRKFADGDYFLPYERSVDARGVRSTVIEELRDAKPAATFEEIGRAYRQKGTIQGEEAKAFWELLVSLNQFPDAGGAAYKVIHTDRQGALLFSRQYGAKIVEAVHPIPSEEGAIKQIQLRRQTEILKDDSPDTEYVLVANSYDFAKKIYDSFSSDPTKILMADKMWWIQSSLQDLDGMLRSYDGRFHPKNP